MNPDQFVNEVASIRLDNVFNPYSDICDIHDLNNAAEIRSNILLMILDVAINKEIDSIWIGRDLGYRGGRRTGLALTDDVHITSHTQRWGTKTKRPTKGEPITERTAAMIWNILTEIDTDIFLWNVFPLHPHNVGQPFTNRSHNYKEKQLGEEILHQLILLLNPKKLVAIGNDAEKVARKLGGEINVYKIRHPSYGGQKQFYKQAIELYNLGTKTNNKLL